MNILFIEDDIELVKNLYSGFQEEGFSLDHVTSLAEAKYLLDIKEYSVIVLDRALSDGDGMNLCLNLRKNGNKTPIIILSAYSETYDIVKGLNSGADDYLKKPFSFVELIARIRALSRRKNDIMTHILKAKDLTLNIMSRVVKRDKQIIELRNNEYNLLLLLLKKKNQVVTKTEIIDFIWDINNFTDQNLLNVTVYNLRKKVESPTREKLIYTVRGIGYKIVG